MIIKNCDRCGAPLPPAERAGFKPQDGRIRVNGAELCGECAAEFEEFMQGAAVLKWNPIKVREMTDEERAELEDIGIDTTARTITESTMPEDGQEVLVTLRDGRMYYDTAYNDNLGHYLDSGIDWEDDVIAWAAPEPYKPEKEGGSEDGLPV